MKKPKKKAEKTPAQSSRKKREVAPAIDAWEALAAAGMALAKLSEAEVAEARQRVAKEDAQRASRLNSGLHSSLSRIGSRGGAEIMSSRFGLRPPR